MTRIGTRLSTALWILLLLPALCLPAACTPPAAEEETTVEDETQEPPPEVDEFAMLKKAEVTIAVKSKSVDGTTEYWIKAAPRGVGVCKKCDKPEAEDCDWEDCDWQVTWKAKDALAEGEKLILKHKSGAEGCFDGEYSITDENEAQEVLSGDVKAGCEPPTAWFYVIEYWKDGVLEAKLDPGVIIDRGRPRR